MANKKIAKNRIKTFIKNGRRPKKKRVKKEDDLKKKKEKKRSEWQQRKFTHYRSL
jgi:hypothetical protein